MPFPVEIGMFTGGQILLPVQVSSILRDRTPPPPETPVSPAHARWGRSATFQYVVSNREVKDDGMDVILKPDEPEEPEPGDIEFTFEEVQELRETSTVRVTNTANPDQWVDVERIDTMVVIEPPGFIQPPDASRLNAQRVLWKFVFRNASA